MIYTVACGTTTYLDPYDGIVRMLDSAEHPTSSNERPSVRGKHPLGYSNIALHANIKSWRVPPHGAVCSRQRRWGRHGRDKVSRVLHSGPAGASCPSLLSHGLPPTLTMYSQYITCLVKIAVLIPHKSKHMAIQKQMRRRSVTSCADHCSIMITAQGEQALRPPIPRPPNMCEWLSDCSIDQAPEERWCPLQVSAL
jgi:hypothetical protein